VGNCAAVTLMENDFDVDAEKRDWSVPSITLERRTGGRVAYGAIEPWASPPSKANTTAQNRQWSKDAAFACQDSRRRGREILPAAMWFGPDHGWAGALVVCWQRAI